MLQAREASLVTVADLEGEVAATVAKLLGAKANDVAPLAGGRNNQLFKVRTDRGPIACKRYPRDVRDRRDRLGIEFGALTLLSRFGISAVPRPLARDETAGIALYQWIEGERVDAPAVADLEAALDLMSAMHRLRFQAVGRWLHDASAAVFSPVQAVAQLQQRRAQFEAPANDNAHLARFLAEFDLTAGRLVGAARQRAERAEIGWDRLLPRAQQTLSPSDMGFHNALRQADGSIIFLDFEYFGWDDPAKLVNDFADHPGSALDAGLATRFRADAAAIYAATDGGYRQRAEVLRILCGLIWCMILLNEFLPDRWQRRHLAGSANDRDAAGRAQLAKATAFLKRLCIDERGMA